MIIQTPRLTLRPFEQGDLDPLAAVFGDPEVMAFSDHGVLDDNALAEWLTKAQKAKNTGRLPVCLAVQIDEHPGTIGYVSLSNDPERVVRGEAELGFRVERLFWGHGYATEAGTALISHAKTIPALDRVVAVVDPNNLASVRVLLKLGMSYEADIMFDGYDYPDHRYALRLR